MMISGRRSPRFRRSTRRDPLSRKEALRRAKELFAQLDREPGGGSFETASVLADVIAYTGHERVTEELALAVARRATPFGAPSVYGWERGLPIDDPNLAKTNLSYALIRAKQLLFPRRSRPCMPNRRDFVTMIMAAADQRSTRLPELNARRATRDLWSLLQAACDSSSTTDIDRAMHEANSILDGHGVERLDVQTRRANLLFADYVNMGDTYVSTLVYDHHADRFRITSWGDMVEMWERRYGRADEDEGW